MTIAVRRPGGLAGVALLVVVFAACGSSSSNKCSGSSCPKDAAPDQRGGDHQDAAADHAKELDAAQARDADVDRAGDARVAADAGSACDQTIAAACAVTHDGGAFALHCAASWDATTANAYFCARPQTTVLSETCSGDTRELIDTNGSDEYVYVYDAAGALHAITHTETRDGGTVNHCVAGPADFTDPLSCSAPALFSCAADAGKHG